MKSTNKTVANAMAAHGMARNASMWSSAEEAEHSSDSFVSAAIYRIKKLSLDNEAEALRDSIKLLASAEQTPKIKKNTDKLKGILSRVEKASALLKGI